MTSQEKLEQHILDLLLHNGESILNDGGVDREVCGRLTASISEMVRESQVVKGDHAELYGRFSIVTERFYCATESHVEATGDGDHQLGDLDAGIAAAWSIMTPAQRRDWLADHRVQAVFNFGAKEDRDGLPIRSVQL